MGFKRGYVLSWHEILSADFRLNFPAFDQLCSSFIRTPLSLITPSFELLLVRRTYTGATMLLFLYFLSFSLFCHQTG